MLKNIWNDPKDWHIREYSRLTRTIFTPKSLLVHGIAETSAENPDNLVLKTNETLDISITENEIDGSHWIGKKKEGQAKTNY